MKHIIYAGRNMGKSIIMEQIMARIYTPEQYLDQLVRSDRAHDMDEVWMTEKLQRQWPGPYKVEKVIDYNWQSVEYKIVFNSPEEETWFRLQQ